LASSRRKDDNNIVQAKEQKIKEQQAEIKKLVMYSPLECICELIALR
jgi:hypothetical protein